MTDTHRQSSLPLLGALLAAGLMAAAFILGIQFKNFRQPGTITVKGLAEKNFQSDSATWRSGAARRQLSGRVGRFGIGAQKAGRFFEKTGF